GPAFPNDNGSDWNFVLPRRFFRKAQRFPHEVLVIRRFDHLLVVVATALRAVQLFTPKLFANSIAHRAVATGARLPKNVLRHIRDCPCKTTSSRIWSRNGFSNRRRNRSEEHTSALQSHSDL